MERRRSSWDKELGDGMVPSQEEADRMSRKQIDQLTRAVEDRDRELEAAKKLTLALTGERDAAEGRNAQQKRMIEEKDEKIALLERRVAEMKEGLQKGAKALEDAQVTAETHTALLASYETTIHTLTNLLAGRNRDALKARIDGIVRTKRQIADFATRMAQGEGDFLKELLNGLESRPGVR